MKAPVLALVLVAFLLTLVPSALATSDCPASQPYFGPYNKIEILPNGYKLMDKPFTVKATRVESGKETPITSRSVKIYKVNGTRGILLDSGNTNSKGEYVYTPKSLGKYKVECAGRAVTFDVKKLYDQPSDFGAVCGNGVCESDKLETQSNCPDDCTVCGDAKCEGSEDKNNCPDDCIICGDGECDEAEYWPGGCSCPEDCIVCGDNICDTAHNETYASCPKDCKNNNTTAIQNGGILETYWWAFLIGAAVLVVILKRGAIKEKLHREKKSKSPKARESSKRTSGVDSESRRAELFNRPKKRAVEEDNDVKEIISELIDTGVSDRRIKEKLKEFGVHEDEADRLIDKAKGGLRGLE